MASDMNTGFGPQETMPPTRQKGWLSRNWLWFVPTLLLGSFLLCGGCCAGILFTAFTAIRASDPYQMALKQVQENPQVIEQIGKPIEEVSWPPPTGEVNITNDRGEANLTFSVRGPKGDAQVLLNARMVDGKWGMTSLNVVTEGGQRISLDMPDEAGGLDEAPAWNP